MVLRSCGHCYEGVSPFVDRRLVVGFVLLLCWKLLLVLLAACCSCFVVVLIASGSGCSCLSVGRCPFVVVVDVRSGFVG